MVVENRTRLFWIGTAALFAAALSTALRAASAGELKALYLDPLDLANSATLLANLLGAAFLGFATMLFVTSLIVDRVGMRAMLLVASASFLVGTGLLLFCDALAGEQGIYRLLWTGMFAQGLGWGATEATINPMVAVLYPEDKTRRMNMLHAYWPAGLVAGGLASVAAAHADVDWRLPMMLVPIAAALFGFLALRSEFPRTESAQLGVGEADRLLEVLRRPSFFVWFGLMFLTSATELAPGQWVDMALSSVVGFRGILLLVYVSAIMFIGRHFAGPLAHRLSAEGLLCCSSALAAIGLFLLSIAASPGAALLAATLWGIGVCYMWPTMIATVAERYPRGGAWTIGLIGVAGALSSYFVLPVLGQVYDTAKVEAAGGAGALGSLTPEALEAVQAAAAAQSFQAVMLIPASLFIAFGLLGLVRWRKKRAPVVRIRERADPSEA